MGYIALGAAGFLIAFFSDHPRIERLLWPKPLILLAAFGAISYAVVMVALHPQRYTLHPALSAAGWVLTALFLLLFIYSVFVEVPLRQAYLGATTGVPLVNTGTYAITRHPGVLWGTLMLVCLFVATGSRLLLIASPIWILMDLAWVYLEDRFYFPKTIPGYEHYKREVPMLVPTLASLRKGLKTLSKPGKANTEVHFGRDP